jgi:hypothetical protein
VLLLLSSVDVAHNLKADVCKENFRIGITLNIIVGIAEGLHKIAHIVTCDKSREIG